MLAMPMKYMGKTTDTSGWLKFWLPQNLLIKAKIYAGRVSNTRVIHASFKFQGELWVEEYLKVSLWNA